MDEKIKTPLIRLAKRNKDALPSPAVWGIRLGSIVFALLLGCLVVALTGNNPIKAYGTMINGAVGSKVYLQQTVKKASPLLGCALAIAPCFKMRSGTSARRARSPRGPWRPPSSPGPSPASWTPCPCCCSWPSRPSWGAASGV